jgi:hypothetical protein
VSNTLLIQVIKSHNSLVSAANSVTVDKTIAANAIAPDMFLIFINNLRFLFNKKPRNNWAVGGS